MTFWEYIFVIALEVSCYYIGFHRGKKRGIQEENLRGLKDRQKLLEEHGKFIDEVSQQVNKMKSIVDGE